MALRPLVIVTPFHRAEIANALFQQVFRGRISIPVAELAYSNFETDCDTGVWAPVNLPSTGFSLCIELARRHVASLGVRTLDTLHVACALELKADRFWTFDERQARLAEAEGLTTA